MLLWFSGLFHSKRLGFFSFLEGDVFIQAKAALEDVYKIYCYHHDDANTSLKSYEKEEEIMQHFTTCVLALK